MRSCITQSIATVKADAALSSFGAAGKGMTWAVMDSGIIAGEQCAEGAGASPDTMRAVTRTIESFDRRSSGKGHNPDP